MMQVSRNLLDVVDGPLIEKQYLILDRDTQSTALNFDRPSRERAFR